MKAAAVISALAAAWLGAGAFGQTSITLRSSARVDPSRPVLLGDVARVEGERAEELAAAVLLPTAPAGGQSITADELRALLKPAGISWGGTTLNGRSCTVVAASAPAEPFEMPEPAAAVIAQDSVRAALTGRIAAILGVEPGALRLSYSEQDRELLDMSAAGRTLEVRTVGASERMALAITLYEGDRIVLSRTIRIHAQVRRSVALSAGAKRRGEVLRSEDITTETRWVAPGVETCAPERVIGAAVRNRLAPGEVITEADLAPPVVVEKGDQVMVRCIAGGVAVAMRARALTDAKDGELVQLQSVDRPGSVFEARMDGFGRAVLVATQTRNPPKQRTLKEKP